MFHQPNHYRLWRLIKKSMQGPTERIFDSLLRRYGQGLQQSGDAANMVYFITLHGRKSHVETSLKLLIPQGESICTKQRLEITLFLKSLSIALWYMPSLPRENVSLAHHYFQKHQHLLPAN